MVFGLKIGEEWRLQLKTVGQYVNFLKDKGFMLKEDAIGFITFGKQKTNATDEITITAIEMTLKTKKNLTATSLSLYWKRL